MKVEAIPWECGRFFVASESRSDVTHTVDLVYREEPWSKPRVACGCESNFIYGRTCPHILATVQYECERLNL